MTDQRTLKKIIVEQKEKIEKLENQIKTVEAVLKDYYFPQIFRDGRRGVRDKCGKEPCADCYIDQDICLQKHRLFERISIALDYQSTKERTKLFSNCCDNIEARCCFCGHVYGVLIRLYQGWCCVDCFQSHILQSNKPKQTMEKSENE